MDKILKQPKVIIYDCDGVLFDSKGANEAFYNHILSHFGIPSLRPEQLEFVHSSTAIEALDYLFPSSSLREKAQDYRHTVDYRTFIPLMRLEPHVREVLERLRSKHRTAIATNRSHTMPSVLQKHGLDELFDVVVTSIDVCEPKPHPEIVWKILRHFNICPDEALYVGDTEVDQLLCQRAGVPFIAYKNRNLKALHHLQDHLDLLKLLEQPSSE